VSHPHYLPDFTAGDFFFNPWMKQDLKVRLLLTLQRFNENHWRLLTASALKILDNVSSSGSNTGIAASSHGGSTLKRAKV
jgi:hypothetical protein